MTSSISKENPTFARDLETLTGENAMLCSQCGQCTLGCPAAYAMKMKPHELIQAIQLGMKEEVFWSGTLWTCLSCEACSIRCIEGIDVLRLIDALREMVLSKELDYYNPFPAVPGYHRLFLSLMNRFGRGYEMGVIVLNNLKMLTPFKDIDLIAALLRKGKLNPLPRSCRGGKALRQVMARVRKLEQAEGRSSREAGLKERSA